MSLKGYAAVGKIGLARRSQANRGQVDRVIDPALIDDAANPAKTGVAYLRAYQPGIGMVSPYNMVDGSSTMYDHADMIGTLRNRTDAGGSATSASAGAMRVMTAFGEPVAGPGVNGAAGNPDRFAYAGAWGYQAATSDDPTADPYESFEYLHVGARYYDPGSGRFLQRDPSGVSDGTNVYVYVSEKPTLFVDPSGLGTILGGHWVNPYNPPHPQVKPPPPKPKEDTRTPQEELDDLKIVINTCIWALTGLVVGLSGGTLLPGLIGGAAGGAAGGGSTVVGQM